MAHDQRLGTLDDTPSIGARRQDNPELHRAPDQRLAARSTAGLVRSDDRGVASSEGAGKTSALQSSGRAGLLSSED